MNRTACVVLLLCCVALSASAQQIELLVGYYQPDHAIRQTVAAGPDLTASVRLVGTEHAIPFYVNVYLTSALTSRWDLEKVRLQRSGPFMGFSEIGWEVAFPFSVVDQLIITPSTGLGLSRYWGTFDIPVVSLPLQRSEMLATQRVSLRVQWDWLVLRTGYVFRSMDGISDRINMGGATAALGFVVSL
jgi:hypothetical protein